MTNDILNSFSTINFPFSFNAKQTIQVITDLLDRTCDFSTNNERNHFTQTYIEKLKSSIKNGNTRTNTYKLDDNTSFVYEQQHVEHYIERFNISFPNEQRNHVTWINILKKDSSFECVDATRNIFITKLAPSAQPKFILGEKFQPQYSGPDNVPSAKPGSRMEYQQGLKIQPYGSSIGFSKRYKHLGIGQLKIAIQPPTDGEMSIGITFSNVFNAVAIARNRINKDIEQLYLDSNIQAKVWCLEEVLCIDFNDKQLVENSRRYHRIFNSKPELYGNELRWFPAYKYSEFLLAKEWKQKLINQFLEDCKSMDANLIANCIDCGIAKIEYTIGRERICSVKLI